METLSVLLFEYIVPVSLRGELKRSKERILEYINSLEMDSADDGVKGGEMANRFGISLPPSLPDSFDLRKFLSISYRIAEQASDLKCESALVSIIYRVKMTRLFLSSQLHLCMYDFLYVA